MVLFLQQRRHCQGPILHCSMAALSTNPMNIWQGKKINHTADGETRLNWTPPTSGGVQTIYVMPTKMRNIIRKLRKRKIITFFDVIKSVI